MLHSWLVAMTLTVLPESCQQKPPIDHCRTTLRDDRRWKTVPPKHRGTDVHVGAEKATRAEVESIFYIPPLSFCESFPQSAYGLE